MIVQVISVITSALVAISSAGFAYFQHRENKRFEIRMKEIENKENRKSQYINELKELVASIVEAAYSIDGNELSESSEKIRLVQEKASHLMYFDVSPSSSCDQLIFFTRYMGENEANSASMASFYLIIDSLVNDYRMPSIISRAELLFDSDEGKTSGS